MELKDPQQLPPLAIAVERALATEQVKPVQAALKQLAGALTADLAVAPVEVKVLARRPQGDGEELHGLYVAEEGRPAQITVWMRTSARRRVVTYRTFLRTFLHELCHHLDFELYRLSETFHTEGFFKRESSLMRALVPRAAPKPSKQPAAKESRATEPPASAPPVGQLSLFDD